MSALAGLAVQLGLPVLQKILNRKLGDKNGELATQIIQAIANRAGVRVEDLEGMVEANQPRVIDAMRDVERMSPEMISLYTVGLEGQFALLQAEQAAGGWQSAWRPGWMYLLGFFWLWNIVALHVLNAYFKIALPPMPYDILMGLTGIYLSLYMGGHTLKDVAAKWVGK